MRRHNAEPQPQTEPIPSMKQLFTEAEAAKQMNISAISLYRRRKEEKARHFRKIGRLIRYTQEDIDRNIEEFGTMRPTLATPEARILAAVHDGATTVKAIQRRTGITGSQIDGLLADMVLNRRELVTKTVGEDRHYYAVPS